MTLALSGVTTAYGDFEFGPVDLTVDREVLAVLGPSGSGKTTLLSLIAGIVAPDAGEIHLDGQSLVGEPLDDRGVGMVFQSGALFPHMTARENVAYAAADGDRVTDLAATLEIGDVLDRKPGALSGGERQRVALARTLAADPDVLVLDEPLSSLDAPIRRRLRDALHDLFASLSIPVLYVTHDQRTATALGDRLAIVRDGGVEQVGTPAAVIDRPANRFVARFTGTENVFDGVVTDHDGDGAVVEVGPHRLRTRTDGWSVGDAVGVCVHPARVTVAEPVGAAPRGENTVDGMVARWLHEGGEYRVDVDAGPVAVTATVRPAAFEALEPDAGTPVRVSIPPDAVHLLPGTGR